MIAEKIWKSNGLSPTRVVGAPIEVENTYLSFVDIHVYIPVYNTFLSTYILQMKIL